MKYTLSIMASSKDYIDYIEGQLSDCGAVSRKMFGEYAFYLDGKVFALVCDNRFLIKITPSSEEMLPSSPRELPYVGGKPMLLVEDVDDAEFLCVLAARTAAELPQPKPKKKK